MDPGNSALSCEREGPGQAWSPAILEAPAQLWMKQAEGCRRTDMSAKDCMAFHRDNQLPELKKDDRDTLEAVMTEEEVTLAL
ncbi:hypothetical protein NDU88_003656 [Pleurodeles waltl]|uniref:Uncharacterized protein n=1 Tax=Pleurodeles waltl TaxID=8319 RepID=A0AAV7NK13_PLEWA|nr:hypothetical protein NDU88_003656 [Pleurodeles waltl]